MDIQQIVAKLQHARQCTATITPDIVEELETLGYRVIVPDTEPSKWGTKRCIIFTNKE